MFKVQENADGSTSIFCKSSGNLICTIQGSQTKRTGPCKVNVVKPRPANVVEPSQKSSWSTLSPSRSHLSNESSLHPDEQDIRLGNRESKCYITPIPIHIDDEPEVTEDYFDDCITEEEFARCLNLVSTEKFNNGNLDQLKSEFPLRLLSRTKGFDIIEDLRELKLPDDMPLTSCLGVKVLKLNPSKNFMDEQTTYMSIKKYDNFCRFPFNTPNPTSINFPKLRCREVKEYPVYYPVFGSDSNATHVFSYGRRQRQDRVLTLDTGLDKRSRSLLRLCNAKRAVVRLKKLTESEVKSWTRRKPTYFSPVTASANECESPLLKEMLTSSKSESGMSSSSSSPEIISTTIRQHSLPKNRSMSTDSFKTSTPKNRLSLKKSFHGLSGKQQSKGRSSLLRNRIRKCTVKAINVLNLIEKRSNNYYVQNTSIRIPFYSEYLSTLQVNKLPLHKLGYGKSKCSTLKSDHAYHRPFLKGSRKTTIIHESHSFRSIKNSREKHDTIRHKNRYSSASYSLPVSQLDTLTASNSALDRMRENSQAVKPIPVVDLTDDTVPNCTTKQPSMPVKSDRFLVSRWVFRCFGCGHKCVFFKKTHMDCAVTEHMQIYHSVSEPDSFLSSYLDSINHCVIIEAFPGYKESLMD